MEQVFQKYNKIAHYKKGISIVEIVIASSIILFITATVFSSLAILTRLNLENTPYVQASFLAEEGIEAIRIMRDKSWSSNIAPIVLENIYRLHWNGSTWVATTTPSLIDDKFDRYFTLSSVNRDSNFNIVSSGGSIDDKTRKITMTVSWQGSEATSTKIIESYMFDTFKN